MPPSLSESGMGGMMLVKYMTLNSTNTPAMVATVSVRWASSGAAAIKRRTRVNKNSANTLARPAMRNMVGPTSRASTGTVKVEYENSAMKKMASSKLMRRYVRLKNSLPKKSTTSMMRNGQLVKMEPLRE